MSSTTFKVGEWLSGELGELGHRFIGSLSDWEWQNDSMTQSSIILAFYLDGEFFSALVAFVFDGDPVVAFVVAQLGKLAAAQLDNTTFKVESIRAIVRVVINWFLRHGVRS